MQNMDGTIVATAIPSMARDLNVDPVHLSSAITAYLVALTVFIPASGWVADRFGARRVFMWAIATFTLASIACAASTSLATLIAARIVQGLGGAMMVPVGRLILFRGVKREELLQATTWLTMPALIGPLLGPPLGGFLTDTLSWRSIFWVNVPVGIAGLLLTWRLLPPSHPEHKRPPDVRGMVLIGASLTLFMIGIESAGRGFMPGGLPWLLPRAARCSSGSPCGIANARRTRQSTSRCSRFPPSTPRRSRAACFARVPARCPFSCR
ncbi:transport system membrane protein [Caballeronia arationis]|nr:transport system membrane protein [Caballeronia arationis]